MPCKLLRKRCQFWQNFFFYSTFKMIFFFFCIVTCLKHRKPRAFSDRKQIKCMAQCLSCSNHSVNSCVALLMSSWSLALDCLLQGACRRHCVLSCPPGVSSLPVKLSDLSEGSCSPLVKCTDVFCYPWIPSN